jgi:hypothetical protein
MQQIFRTAIIALGLAAAPASATTLADPQGDFIPTYTGPQAGDLDVIEVNALYANAGVRLTAALAAAPGTTPGAPYVWGVDRGTGTAGFGAIAPGVLFDAVVVIFASGAGSVTLLAPAVVNTPLPGGSVTVDGNIISVFVPRDFLPSTGFDFGDYGYNLWPRDPLTQGVAGVSDFAPDNDVFKASFVPEPATWALLIAGFGTIGMAARRRRLAA